MKPQPKTILRILLASFFALAGPVAIAATDYQYGPDSEPHDGVPKGSLTKHTWESKIFEGTTRDYWVYIPAKYDRSKPACLMVVQDGARRINPKGDARFPIVLDNLIHKKEIPETVGIFINPGEFPAENGKPAKPNRSFEYDTLSDQYVRFLLEEVIPEVEKEHGITFTSDPEGWAIYGQSSGATAAFTAAWERPDKFHKVISGFGSFTAIAYSPATEDRPMRPGADLYPTLIRKNPIKPLRVFLQDGSNDLDNAHGNWFLANQQMLSALEWANANADENNAPGPRYQLKHVWGDGTHGGQHIGTILPDVLRWVWADYQPKP